VLIVTYTIIFNLRSELPREASIIQRFTVVMDHSHQNIIGARTKHTVVILFVLLFGENPQTVAYPAQPLCWSG